MAIMVVSRTRAALPAIASTHCWLALFKSFIPNASVSTRPPTKPPFSQLTDYQSRSRRCYSVFHSWRSDLIQQRSPSENGAIENDNSLEAELAPSEDGAPTSATSTPWYLQVDMPQRTSNPLLQSQQIPELPPDPPPLLQPMLEHISTDLGLDDLKLYDLRNIDPPPALGANLLMVLGTARSEKHLHVSADRFCRWLKTTHKLSPYADGLMGRGELKLKLRRKARRARLLSNVGSSETSNVDDGIRTGWICVDVGTIDDGRAPVETLVGQEGYVGFGEEVGGAKVVIQMLTAEKREELDLEDLWGKMQRRQQRKEERFSRGQAALLTTQEIGPWSSKQERSSSDLLSSLSSSSKPPIGKFDQRRYYHHQSVSLGVGPEAFLNGGHRGLDELSLEPDIRPPETSHPERETESTFSSTQEHQHSGGKGHFGDASKLIALQTLVDHLERLPSQDAIRALGKGAGDFDSTAFLSSFYQSYPLFPSVDHWECRLAVVCHGIIIGHPGYSKFHLEFLTNEMQSSLVEIPARIFLRLFKTFLTSFAKDAAPLSLSERSVLSAANVLEFMSLHGHDILTEEIRSDLLVATLRVFSVANDHPKKLSRKAFQNLMYLFDCYLGKPPTVETELRIFHEYADQWGLSGIEEYWRFPARYMRPRPRAMYLAMFRRVAQSKYRTFVMRMLRECIPEMHREEPAVQLDADLAQAVMECVLVAEPNIKRMAMDESNHEREWVRLWRHCQEAL
ncbi:hypothetical protein N7G274_003222 [Stereocaulon virgatum]|uniref:ATPase synthesis protein 25 n=1 Tax=Stereocaulon virgatum TaxID=373712 RepID=A0ABR4AFB6_9LECA